MAHDNKNDKTIKAASAVSKAYNKKGKLKGKNKKETKYLKRSCVHHYYNKNGKLKKDFFNNNNGECICNICGCSFPTKIESKDNIREQADAVRAFVDQATVAAIAGHHGNKIIDKFVNLKVLLAEFPKDYNRTLKAVSKEDNMKKKKKKHNGGNGSNQFGSWNNSKKNN